MSEAANISLPCDAAVSGAQTPPSQSASLSPKASHPVISQNPSLLDAENAEAGKRPGEAMRLSELLGRQEPVFGGAAAGCDALRYRLLKTVFFVGFMGAGKTSLARKMARRFGTASIDLDSYIVRNAGMSIRDIFDLHGETGFRQIEAQALREVLDLGPSFVSCGGGAVLLPENRRLLKKTGFVVYLQVEPEEAFSRISNHANRPLLARKDEAIRIAHERVSLYDDVAHATIDTAGCQSHEVARKVSALLEEEGVVCRLEKS